MLTLIIFKALRNISYQKKDYKNWKEKQRINHPVARYS